MELMTLIWLALGVTVLFIIAFVSFFVWWLRVYKYKFRIYENLSGLGYEEARTIRGRLVTIANSANEKVFWLPKEKCYYSAYGRKMGKNLYWCFYGPDGLLYNCVAGDLDGEKGVLDIEPVDNDVRAFHTTQAKNARERYDKPKNWPVVLMSFTIIIAILILVVGGYLISKRQNEGLQIINSQLEATKSLSETTAKLALANDRINTQLMTALSNKNLSIGGLLDAPGG